MSQNLNIWGVLDESGTDGGECSWKVGSRRRIAGAIRSLVNARDVQMDNLRGLLGIRRMDRVLNARIREL